MRYFVTVDGQEYTFEVSAHPGGGYDVQQVESDGGAERATPVACQLMAAEGALAVNVGGRVFDLVLDGEMPAYSTFASGRRTDVQIESARMRAAASMRGKGGGGSDGFIVSPMPGKVVKVLVTEGEEVAAGKAIIVVEAMKMENELVAETPGTVKTVFVKPGDAVEGGAKLVQIV